MLSDPCKLSYLEYQNLLSCPDEEFVKWAEAAWSWKKEPSWKVWKLRGMELALGIGTIVVFVLALTIIGTIVLGISGILWR